MPSSAPHLELNHVSIAYRQNKKALRPVVQDLSFELNHGEIACLLGPSGCGKTTLLRALAGFEPLATGNMILNGSVISDAQFVLPPEQRHIGIVFQDYALFPHLSVQKNIEFGLSHWEKSLKAQRSNELLNLVGLLSIKDKFPHEISGGQQQRVALARALAPQPELLLLDEPFSSLDAELRQRLSIELRDILKQTGVTALMVTHDQQEAFAISDKIAVMEQGRLLQWDTAYQLYHHPKHPFVARFIGGGRYLSADNQRQLGLKDDTTGSILLRQSNLVYASDGAFKAIMVKKYFQGPGYVGIIKLSDGQEFELSLPANANHHQIGDEIGISLALG